MKKMGGKFWVGNDKMWWINTIVSLIVFAINIFLWWKMRKDSIEKKRLSEGIKRLVEWIVEYNGISNVESGAKVKELVSDIFDGKQVVYIDPLIAPKWFTHHLQLCAKEKRTK
jgi:hypothetical protein